MSADGEEWKGEPEEAPYGGSIFSSFWGLKPLTPEQKAELEKKVALEKAEAEMRSVLVARFNVATVCVKCGNAESKTHYCAGAEAGYSTSHSCFKQTAGREHFHRTCKRCRYVWYEWPLDGEHA